MSKIERNEILEKVNDLNPEEAKRLLANLLKVMDDDIEYRYGKANSYREKGDYEISNYYEEGAFAQVLQFSFVSGWLGFHN